MNDPLTQGPLAEHELFQRLSQLSSGFPRDAVFGAAANLLLNAIRQDCATRAKAEVSFDDSFGRLKSILLAHYDGAGRRRSVFPFRQSIEVPCIDMRHKNGR